MFAPIMSDADPYDHCPPPRQNEQEERSGPDPGQDSDDAPPPLKLESTPTDFVYCVSRLCIDSQGLQKFPRKLPMEGKHF